MEKIKKILIVIFILIIILIGIIYILLKKQVKTQDGSDEDFNEYGGEILPEEDKNGYIDVNDSNIFFSIVDCVEKYVKISKLNIEYASPEVYINEDEYLLEIKNEEQRKMAIYNLLDKNYITENSITEQNVDKYTYGIDNDTILLPKAMKVKNGTNVNTYIYEAYLIKNKVVSDKFFVVRVNNKKFSIEFINKDVDDISNINVEENEDSIEDTGYNRFTLRMVRKDEVIQEYLELYKQLLFADPSIIYNNYMTTEYKENRFASLEEYKNYINDNINDIRVSQITKYMTEETEDNKVRYVGVDQYENYYIFDEEATMKYTIKLDNYTIPTENFKTTYNQAYDEKKVQMNIDKFIQMINRHDYTNSYKCISEGFKNNYFNTQDKFENYIKNTFFNYNKFEFNNIEKKGNNLYTCNFSITDLTGQNTGTRKITIIMQLKDNLNFEMSFAID